MATVRANIDKRQNGVLSDRGADGYVATRVVDFTTETKSSGMDEYESEALILPGGSTLRQVTVIVEQNTVASNGAATVKIQQQELKGTSEGSWEDLSGTSNILKAGSEHFLGRASTNTGSRYRLATEFHRRIRLQLNGAIVADKNIRVILDFVNL